MGEVYRARDSRLGRDVAVKVLPEHLARDPQALARFEREARTVAALSHPNILALFDIGSEPGVSYAVTELLEGETLRSRLALAAIPWRKAVEMAVALAEGLAAAHAKGITHRDLKPENIFLTSDGRVKILDFGLARWQPREPAGDATDAPTQTQAGTVMGTIGYMSPEQVRGEKADAPSDIFSLGCVLHEMLTGRRAFQRPSPADTLAAILKEDPPELAGVSPELARLVSHCLEKNPNERFQSARDLTFALRSLGAPAETAEAPADSLAVLPFANAGGPDAEYLSDGIAESLINSFSQIARLRVVPRSAAFRYKGREVDPQAVGRELGVRMLLTGKVVERGGRLSVQAELVDVAANKQLWGERLHRQLSDIFEVEEEIARQIAEKLRVRLSGEETKQLARRYTEDSEAYQLYLKARFHFLKRTTEGLQKGVEYCEQAIEKDPEFALAYAALADCYLVLGSLSVCPPKQLKPKALQAGRRAVEIDGGLAEAHNSLAYLHAVYEWDWAEAERGFRHALELNPASWIAHDWYGLTLSCQGRMEEAIAETRRAQQLEPLSLVLHHHAAWLLWLARRYDDAIAECRKALEMDPNFYLLHFWLGLSLEQQSRHEEAVAALRKAYELAQANPLQAGSLGHALAAAGRRDEAEKVWRELEAQSKTGYVEPYAMALIHAGLGATDRVFEWLEKAYDDISGWLTLCAKGDPRFDHLRPDPRFQDLLRRMGLA